jgi:hypothetical protein
MTAVWRDEKMVEKLVAPKAVEKVDVMAASTAALTAALTHASRA